MLKILIGALAAYTLYCCALFLLQRQIIFPRYLMASGQKAARPTGVQEHWIEFAGGRVEAWLLPPERNIKPAPLMIVAHGNAERIDDLPPEFFPIAALGIGVLLVEYPGYGRSPGKPAEPAVTAAMVAAYDEMRSRPDVDPARIVLYGRSLGGGAVCALAARRPSAAMILVSTFTSVRSFARRYGVPGFLVRDPFENLPVVKSYARPILVVHGRYDDVIPFSHGEALHQAAPASEMIAYACAHNDCPPDPDRFIRDLSEFLNRSGILGRKP